jgi:hypothetical protein
MASGIVGLADGGWKPPPKGVTRVSLINTEQLVVEPPRLLETDQLRSHPDSFATGEIRSENYLDAAFTIFELSH